MKEVFYQIIGRHGSTRLQHHAPIAHGSVAGKQILLIELLKEILGNHLVPHVDVIEGRVAAEVIERGIQVGFRRRDKLRVMAQIIEAQFIQVDVLRAIL